MLSKYLDEEVTAARLDSDALVLGEDFISEHYFTTDARAQSFQAKVLERRKAWDTVREEGTDVTRSRFLDNRSALVKAFIGLAENADTDTLAALYEQVREILGYNNALRWDTEREGPVLRIRTRGLSGAAPLVIIEARGALDDLLAKDEKTLSSTYCTDDDTQITSAARLLSREIESWCTAMQAMRLSPQTIELRAYHIRRLAGDRPADTPWTLAPSELLDWAGRHSWGSETARAMRSSLRRFWAWGIATGRTEQNTAAVIPMIRLEQLRPRRLTLWRRHSGLRTHVFT